MIVHFKEHRLRIGQSKLAVVVLPQGVKRLRGNAIGFDGVMPGCEECAHVTDERLGDLGRVVRQVCGA